MPSQLIGLPDVHTPAAVQLSPYVQRFPSSHVVPVRIVSVHVGPPLHSRSMHAASVHVTRVPPPHAPDALQASP